MGSDSNGPLLAVWLPDDSASPAERARFSFVDLETLTVLKAGPVTSGGFQGIGKVSASGGSITLHPFLQDRVHVRASAGGDLYGIWQTKGMPSGFQTLAVYGGVLRGIYNHDGLDHLAPGPDGRTVYTGRGGPLSAEGKPLSGSDQRPPASAEVTIPSQDPAYYLTVTGFNRPRHLAGPQPRITASVHVAGDGARLLTVFDLDEMAPSGAEESTIEGDFTVDKRFHLVPAARLLITVPPTNDRLVLRRLDIEKALGELGADAVVVTSPAILHAPAGEPLEHQIVAHSRAGGVKCALTDGPEGLAVSINGKLTWLPPKSLAGQGGVFSVVVDVADSAGKERFHTITIRVD